MTKLYFETFFSDNGEIIVNNGQFTFDEPLIQHAAPRISNILNSTSLSGYKSGFKARYESVDASIGKYFCFRTMDLFRSSLLQFKCYYCPRLYFAILCACVIHECSQCKLFRLGLLLVSVMFYFYFISGVVYLRQYIYFDLAK